MTEVQKRDASHLIYGDLSKRRYKNMATINSKRMMRSSCIDFIHQQLPKLNHGQLVRVLHIIRSEIGDMKHIQQKDEGICIFYENLSNVCLERLFDYLHDVAHS